MQDTGSVKWFLGIILNHYPEGIYSAQISYLNKFLENFKIQNWKEKLFPLSPGE